MDVTSSSPPNIGCIESGAEAKTMLGLSLTNPWMDTERSLFCKRVFCMSLAAEGRQPTIENHILVSTGSPSPSDSAPRGTFSKPRATSSSSDGNDGANNCLIVRIAPGYFGDE